MILNKRALILCVVTLIGIGFFLSKNLGKLHPESAPSHDAAKGTEVVPEPREDEPPEARAKNKREERIILIEKAEKGDAESQYQLALARGRLKVEPELFALEASQPRRSKKELLTMAANQGHLRAQVELAEMYRFDDPVQAEQWLRKAAEKGDDSAQASLGSMLLGESGVSTNYAEALDWLKKAADKNNLLALMSLRDVYTRGLGVAKDEKEALKYEARFNAVAPVNEFAERMEQEKKRREGTPAEGKKMSQDETAREQVRRAFANYWLVVNGSNYLTKVVPQSIQTKGIETTVWVNDATGETTTTRPPKPAFYGKDSPRYTEKKVIATNGTGDNNFFYLQISPPVFTWSRDDLTDADRLNGITYRGSAQVNFAVYRIYDPKTSLWEDWQDSTHYGNKVSAAIGKLSGPSAPTELRKLLKLNFKIVARNKTWSVETDSKSGGETLQEPPSMENARLLLK